MSAATSQLELNSVWVIIPTLNEESSIALVLDHLPPVGRVIVVDNGSTDATAAIAKRHGATVVLEESRGYGAACLRGLKEIPPNTISSGPKVIVFIDADFSDHPDELPGVVGPILNGEADFVLGTRLRGNREAGSMPPQSIFGNRLACFLMRLVWKAEYTDLGPFRAITVDALEQLQMQDRNFGWTVEMQIKAAQQNLRVKEVPVSYRRRIGTSKISWTLTGTLKAGFKILFVIAKFAVNDILKRKPSAT